jgi:hypothetical protein
VGNLGDALNNPLITLLSLALAVVSIVLACVFFHKSRRIKEPCWAVRSINLIKGYSARLRDLDVLFRGERVENLSISRIAFWNHGSDTINAADIPTKSPLQITVKDIRLLDIRILQTNHDSCNFSVELDKNGTSARIGFDYCDRGQGVVLQVVHTGTGATDIVLEGKVKGAPLERREIVSPALFVPIKAAIVAGVGMIAVGSMKPQVAIDPLLMTLGVILFLGGVFLAARYWRARLPSGLEFFYSSQLDDR